MECDYILTRPMRQTQNATDSTHQSARPVLAHRTRAMDNCAVNTIVRATTCLRDRDPPLRPPLRPPKEWQVRARAALPREVHGRTDRTGRTGPQQPTAEVAMLLVASRVQGVVPRTQHLRRRQAGEGQRRRGRGTGRGLIDHAVAPTTVLPPKGTTITAVTAVTAAPAAPAPSAAPSAAAGRALNVL